MSLRKTKLREEHSEVDTGPLNDILFILLMFFLMISTLANPNVIKLSVPTAKSEGKQKQSVVVSIDSSLNFFVGTDQIQSDTASIRQALIDYKMKGDTTNFSVIINADKKTAWSEIVKVMQVARAMNATTSATVTGE